MNGADLAVHLAANADVRFGLEAMRVTGVKRIAFVSTGSVHGEASVIPTPEDWPFPVQTSLYAASTGSSQIDVHRTCRDAVALQKTCELVAAFPSPFIDADRRDGYGYQMAFRQYRTLASLTGRKLAM